MWLNRMLNTTALPPRRVAPDAEWRLLRMLRTEVDAAPFSDRVSCSGSFVVANMIAR